PGLPWRETLGDAFLDPVIQVKLQLLVQLALHPSPLEDGPEPEGSREPPVFHAHGVRPPRAGPRRRWPRTAAASSRFRSRAVSVRAGSASRTSPGGCFRSASTRP